MTTKAARAIGDHLMMDAQEVEGYRYQPTRWTKPVYAIGQEYWCAGPKPARHTQDDSDALAWTRITSSQDGKTVLWLAIATEE